MDSTRCKGSRTLNDPRLAAIPDSHGHAKGEHKLFVEERPIAYSARMLFLWFYHACRRGMPRFVMVADHINYLTFEDPGAVHTVRRALKLAEAGDLYGAAETAGVDVAHAAVVSQGLRRGMRFSIGAELDNDPRSRPDAQNIVDAMRPDAMIRSVHFLAVEHPEKGADWQWPFDNPEFKDLYEVVGTERVWELYIERLADDVEKLPGHIVGHFYAPAAFGHWPELQRLEAYEDRILALCLARGMAIEIDTRPLYRNSDETELQRYREANLRLMRKAKERGVPIAIGSDAHSPKDQGGAFDVVLAMLDEAEINEIVFPVGGRLARVALRATKEHLEKLKQQEPPAAVPGSSISGMGRAELGLPERDEQEIAREEAEAARSAREEGSKRRTASPARSKKRVTAKASDESTSQSRPAKGGPGSDVAAAAALAAAGETVKDAAEALRPKTRTASKKRPAKAAEQPTLGAAPARVAEPKRVEPARAAKGETKSPKSAPAAKAPATKRPAAKTAPATKSKASATKAAAKSPARATASKGAKSTARAKTVKASSTATKRPTKAKPTAKKATPSKTTAKKPSAKAAPAKKTTAKKPAPKAAPKRAAAKKASKTVRKPAPKKPARKATSKRR